MFERLGRIVHRHRWVVLAVFVLALLACGWYGRDLNSRLSQEGWFDETTESAIASKLADATFGRDTDGDVIALYTAPQGRTVDDPAIAAAARARFAELLARYPNEIAKIDSYWDYTFTAGFADASRGHAFASIGLRGEGVETLRHFDAIRATSKSMVSLCNSPGCSPWWVRSTRGCSTTSGARR